MCGVLKGGMGCDPSPGSISIRGPRIRRYRCAQPPATRWQAYRLAVESRRSVLLNWKLTLRSAAGTKRTKGTVVQRKISLPRHLEAAGAGFAEFQGQFAVSDFEIGGTEVLLGVCGQSADFDG